MPAAVRTVQNLVEKPGSGNPMLGKQVSIRLNTPSFLDGGTREKVRTAYATTGKVTDADTGEVAGQWSAVLEVNADLDPAGTYYTVSEVPGVVWSFVVPAGDPDVPVTLRECLVEDPQSPGNPVATSFGWLTYINGVITGTGNLLSDVDGVVSV